MTHWGHTGKGQSQVFTAAAICQPSCPSVLACEHGSLRYPVWPFPYCRDLISPSQVLCPLWPLTPSSAVVVNGVRCYNSLLDRSPLDAFEFPGSGVEPGTQ